MKSTTISIFALAATLLIAIPANSQNIPMTMEQMKRMHHEKQEDPYLPNADNNQRTTPAYRYKSRVKSNPNQTSVTTVQVNVNALGQNIVGDAANEPSIAVNPLNPGKMVIGWRQFDNVTSNFRQAGWGYTVDGGDHWTFPGVINPGIFRSDPVLDYDADGKIYYNSLTNSPDYYCKVYRSSNSGASWDDGIDAAGGDKQWMVIDRTNGTSRGNIYADWSYYFSTCAPGFATRSTNGGDSYESCFVIDGYPYWGTLAVGNAGELYVGGVGGAMDSLIFVKSLTARDRNSLVTWEKPVKVFIDGNPGGWQGVNPGGLLGQVNIDVDHSNGPGRDNIYMLGTLGRKSNTDPGDIMFTRSTDGGLTWSPPLRINDDISTTNYQWFGTMSVAPTGRIDAVWLDTRDAPAGSDSSALYYSYSNDQGKSWTRNERLSGKFDPHVGYPNQNKIGDYIDMFSDSTSAHLAWANTFNGEQDVYYSHIVPYKSTGIDEIANNAKISVYPNPVTGTLSIRGLAADSRIELYTVPGVKVYSSVNGKSSFDIDMTAQPAGIYLLKIVDRNGSTFINKIVKK